VAYPLIIRKKKNNNNMPRHKGERWHDHNTREEDKTTTPRHSGLFNDASKEVNDARA